MLCVYAGYCCTCVSSIDGQHVCSIAPTATAVAAHPSVSTLCQRHEAQLTRLSRTAQCPDQGSGQRLSASRRHEAACDLRCRRLLQRSSKLRRTKRARQRSSARRLARQLRPEPEPRPLLLTSTLRRRCTAHGALLRVFLAGVAASCRAACLLKCCAHREHVSVLLA